MKKGAQNTNLDIKQINQEEMKTEEAVEKQDKSKINKKNQEKKKQTKRVNLDENKLLYGQNGIRKFYEIIMKTDFNSSKEMNNLNKFIQIFKNWHFMLIPKFDMNLFIAKLNDIGRKASARSYMSRLRKIYKGEEDWDILFTDNEKAFNQENSLNNKNENTNHFSPGINNKVFNEDFRNPNNNNIYENKKNSNFENFKLIENKLNKVSLNKDVHQNLHDIDNDNFITEEEVKEFKFENFENDEAKINSEAQKQHNHNNILNNVKTVKMNHITTEDDYDLFYQMEEEENVASQAYVNKNSNQDICIRIKEDIQENVVDNNMNKQDNAFGKRTHSEAFGDEESSVHGNEKCDSLPLKIRKTMDF